MNVGIITIGDELLSGDIENSNATWLCTQLTEAGVVTDRVVMLPDRKETISEHVRDYSDTFDAVIITGGLGDTPDDVTMEAIAEAFEVDLVINRDVRKQVETSIQAIQERIPDFSVNIEREAAIPEGSRPLVNQDGLSPGCVLGNVYVFPGIPREMKAMFESVSDEFQGNIQSRSFWTGTPEASLVPSLEAFNDEFHSVTLSCYPKRDGDNRLKLTGDDPARLDQAEEWIYDHINIRK